MAKCNLIAYDPVNHFGDIKDYWIAYAKFYQQYWGGPTSPFGVWFGNEYKLFRTALSNELDIEESEIRDCYFLYDENDELFVSPHFDEMQNYMIYAENIVPFEWLALYEESERKTLFTHWGFNAIYYDAKTINCLGRIDNKIDILTNRMPVNEKAMKQLGIWNFFNNIKNGLYETKKWVESFSPNGYLILNYGEICNFIHYFTLDKEHSVNDLDIILQSLMAGNLDDTSSKVNIFLQKWAEISELASGSDIKSTIQ